MRSRTSHAAESGVGEHKARESESAQHCATGKSAWRAPTPNLAPEPQGSGALFFTGGRATGRLFCLRTPAGRSTFVLFS
jgi:hypothetical protein